MYGFDWPHLERLADRHGPTPAEVDDPLAPDDIVDESLRCPAFAAAPSGPDERTGVVGERAEVLGRAVEPLIG